MEEGTGRRAWVACAPPCPFISLPMRLKTVMTWPWESEKVWRCLEHPAETDAQELLLHAAAHGLSAEEASFVADQMEGARRRGQVSALAAQPRLLFPPRLNREQSSSQPTAPNTRRGWGRAVGMRRSVPRWWTSQAASA